MHVTRTVLITSVRLTQAHPSYACYNASVYKDKKVRMQLLHTTSQYIKQNASIAFKLLHSCTVYYDDDHVSLLNRFQSSCRPLHVQGYNSCNTYWYAQHVIRAATYVTLVAYQYSEATRMGKQCSYVRQTFLPLLKFTDHFYSVYLFL